MARRWIMPMAAGLLATAVATCSAPADQGEAPATVSPLFPDEAPPPPQLDERQVTLGADLYQQNCASCHGADLSGDPDWMTPNPDGSFRPPPHDSSGHTWHHSDQLLAQVIRGDLDFPESRMPAFAGLLSDEEIKAIIEYLKASWGPQERAFQWQVTWQEAQRPR